MAATKEQAAKNLKKKTKGRAPRLHATKQELDFAAHFVFGGKPVEAAIYAGIPVTPYIYQILRKPAIVAYIETQRAEMAKNATEDAREKFELTGEFIDIQVAQRLVKKKMKDRDFNDLARTSFESIGRIKPVRFVQKTRNDVQAQMAAALAVTQGEGLPHLFEPPWKKAMREAQTVATPPAEKKEVTSGT